MPKGTCIECNRSTPSLIDTPEGKVCLQCYSGTNSNGEKRKHSTEEADMQTEFFKTFHTIFPKVPDKLIFAVPNGGSRNKIEAANLMRQGVKSGVADVILLIPRKGFASLCMEFKTSKGKQSDEQTIFQKQAEKCGSKYVIVRSVANAIEIVKDYLT